MNQMTLKEHKRLINLKKKFNDINKIKMSY